MLERRCSTWSEAEEAISDFQSDMHAEFSGMRVSFLFRGQALFDWELRSSLERELGDSVPIREYDLLLQQIAPAVEMTTGRQWELQRPEFPIDDDPALAYFIPNFDFIAYARHHGLPTPLLDWSQSPYVALFFAYWSARPEADVAVYCYLDEFKVGLMPARDSSRVFSLGEMSRPHRRHFDQQSMYTVSTKRGDKEWVYSSHEQYFASSARQNVALKLSLPGSLRSEILAMLHHMNINPFTLFGDEESLFQTLWYRHIEVDDSWRHPVRLVPFRDEH